MLATTMATEKLTAPVLTTVKSVIKIGKLLLTAKELTADPNCGIEGPNPDVRFSKWVNDNLSGLDAKACERFQNVARTYGDRDPSELGDINLSIIYELAAPVQESDIVQPAKTAWTDDQWASYINAPEANPVLAIIERGRRLKECRDACDQKGDRSNTFEAFCKKHLTMTLRSANRFIAVAEWAKSQDTLCPNSLPASWGTLYELTRLTEAEFDAAIKSGAIHPEMTRAEAEALRGKQRKETASSDELRAWDHIKTASKMMRDDWRKVGEALLIGRRKFTNERGELNGKGFGQWCRENGFGDMARQCRDDAMWLASKWDAIFRILEDRPDAGQGRLIAGASHPSEIRLFLSRQ